MRIISGKHKGRKIPNAIKLPVRPTTDQAKEALFNILENSFYFNNIAVLDLFSGTGNISYEFSSRGCKDIICIDENYRCIKFIKKNTFPLLLIFNIYRNISSKNYTSLEYFMEHSAQIKPAMLMPLL